MMRSATAPQLAAGRPEGQARLIYTVSMLRARRFVVRGRVQGVGFRYFTERAAAREGIHGWVANREDGAVEVFAEGDLEALDRFEATLRHGPPAARVEDVFVDDDVPSGRATGFSVRS
jgi:acylphosphatase